MGLRTPPQSACGSRVLRRAPPTASSLGEALQGLQLRGASGRPLRTLNCYDDVAGALLTLASSSSIFSIKSASYPFLDRKLLNSSSSERKSIFESAAVAYRMLSMLSLCPFVLNSSASCMAPSEGL